MERIQSPNTIIYYKDNHVVFLHSSNDVIRQKNKRVYLSRRGYFYFSKKNLNKYKFLSNNYCAKIVSFYLFVHVWKLILKSNVDVNVIYVSSCFRLRFVFEVTETSSVDDSASVSLSFDVFGFGSVLLMISSSSIGVKVGLALHF